ncbi:MAG: hypothetical protein HY658_05930 [Actinobacteria bacterium]|nr:hypothetical protein [Actinomycetota bacterium]
MGAALRTAVAALVPAALAIAALGPGIGPAAAGLPLAAPDAVAAAVQQGPRARQVVVFLIDRVGLDDLAAARTPALDRLVASGAIGLLTMPVAGVRGGADAYATVAAGAPTDVGPTGSLAFEADEEVAGGTGYRLWESLVGREPTEGAVVVPYARHLADRSAALHPPAVTGLLGNEVRGAGLETAVVGNADAPEAPPGPLGVDAPTAPLPPGINVEHLVRHRPLALLVADRGGLVDGGAVGPGLLVEDRSAPGGVRTDPEAFLAAAEASLEEASLVAIDPGDLARVDLAGGGAADRIRAVEDADRLLGEVKDMVDLGETLLVVGALAPSDEMVAAGDLLVPVAMAGPGVPAGGLLSSPTTRLPGLVSGVDLGPTILEALGLRVPAAMRGRAIEVVDAAAGDTTAVGRVERLLVDVRESRERARSEPWVDGLLVAAALLAALAALLSRRRVAVAAGSAVLWVLLTPAPGIVWGLAAPVVLAAFAWWVAGPRPARTLGQLWVLGGAILLVDLAFEGSLQRAGALGPDVAGGAEMAWMGGPAVGVVVGSWILVAGMAAGRGWRLAIALGGLALAAALGIAGGSAAGAVVAGAATIAVARSGGGRLLRPGPALAALVAGVAVGAAVVAIDAARGIPGQASAWWRTVQDLGWAEGIAVALDRSLDALVAAATTPWTPVVLAAAYAIWDRWPDLETEPRRLLRALVVGAGVALVATDAGPAIAGILALLGSALAATGLAPDRRPSSPARRVGGRAPSPVAEGVVEDWLLEPPPPPPDHPADRRGAHVPPGAPGSPL